MEISCWTRWFVKRFGAGQPTQLFIKTRLMHDHGVDQNRIQEGFMDVYGFFVYFFISFNSPSNSFPFYSPPPGSHRVNPWKIRATPKSPTILAPKKTCDSVRYLRESNTLDTASRRPARRDLLESVYVCFMVNPFWGEGDSYVERSI